MGLSCLLLYNKDVSVGFWSFEKWELDWDLIFGGDFGLVNFEVI